jgi:hypothetical protein
MLDGVSVALTCRYVSENVKHAPPTEIQTESDTTSMSAVVEEMASIY